MYMSQVAFLSLFVYFVMAVFSIVGLIFRVKLAELIVSGSVCLVSWFTFLALLIGSVWAKPMSGAWRVSDARLTLQLILLFLYLSVFRLRSAILDHHTALQATAILLIIGLTNLPIIHYSFYWWNTLH